MLLHSLMLMIAHDFMGKAKKIASFVSYLRSQIVTLLPHCRNEQKPNCTPSTSCKIRNQHATETANTNTTFECECQCNKVYDIYGDHPFHCQKNHKGRPHNIITNRFSLPSPLICIMPRVTMQAGVRTMADLQVPQPLAYSCTVHATSRRESIHFHPHLRQRQCPHP